LTPQEAKIFLSRKIQETAQINGIEFDKLEKEMLFWSSDREEDFLELGKKFSQEHNEAEYEKKVIKILRLAYDSDVKNDSPDIVKYKQASKALRQGDHYLLVMFKAALGRGSKLFGWLRFGTESSSFSDYLSLIVAGLLISLGLIAWAFIKAGLK
jgi:hypothetical protein